MSPNATFTPKAKRARPPEPVPRGSRGPLTCSRACGWWFCSLGSPRFWLQFPASPGFQAHGLPPGGRGYSWLRAGPRVDVVERSGHWDRGGAVARLLWEVLSPAPAPRRLCSVAAGEARTAVVGRRARVCWSCSRGLCVGLTFLGVVRRLRQSPRPSPRRRDLGVPLASFPLSGNGSGRRGADFCCLCVSLNT